MHFNWMMQNMFPYMFQQQGVLFLEILFQLILAVVLGGLLGFERERAGRPAGIRTYSLICLGSTLFTILSIYGFGSVGEASRVAAQIVVGVGFLGAGVILHKEKSVIGLTTAAGMWVSSAIGMAVGTNNYFLALATTVLTMIIFFFNDTMFISEDKTLKK